MCCVQYDTYYDACYSHGMTFLIQFGKSTDLTFHKSCCFGRVILTHACPWCVLAHTHTQYKCVLIPYKYLLLGAGTGGRQILRYDIAATRTWIFHPDMVGPHAFEAIYYHYLAQMQDLASGACSTSVSFHIHFRLCIGVVLERIRLIQL